jgi:hypothetical protein
MLPLVRSFPRTCLFCGVPNPNGVWCLKVIAIQQGDSMQMPDFSPRLFNVRVAQEFAFFTYLHPLICKSRGEPLRFFRMVVGINIACAYGKLFCKLRAHGADVFAGGAKKANVHPTEGVFGRFI